MSKLPSLTALRFFAAFWVFCFHSFLWMGDRSVVADLSSVGYAGVSVFFVLSGFILSYNYLGSDFTLKEFWAARAARIAPVYWLTLLLAFPPLLRNLMIGRLSPSVSVIAAPVFLQSWFPVPQIWNTPGVERLSRSVLLRHLSIRNPTVCRTLPKASCFFGALSLCSERGAEGALRVSAA